MKEMIRTVIIDDEPLAREIIKAYLADFPEISVAAECSNGLEAIKVINEINPELIFLDIQMPKITGFEMLEVLEEIPVTIFTTAYDQYALKAFEVNAADYLLKPFSRERFREAVTKAFIFLNDRNSHRDTITKVMEQIDRKDEYLERIVFKNGSRVIIIPAEKLIYLEAQDDYVMLHSTEGRFMKLKTMKYFEDHLDPSRFIRIHRSFIVSLTAIKQLELFEKESYRITLNDGSVLPVSRNGYSKLKELLT